MRITVHRGSREIGGTCIELASGASRIILDAGLPLESDLANGPITPLVPGLYDENSPSVDGLFLSHAHADHSGLVSASQAQVPVWLTAGTSKMIFAGSLFARQPEIPRSRQCALRPGVPVSVGAFRVTAYPVDHSIYDAMAFLVEADGQRLLYTGDLRFHGRKPGMALQLAKIATAAPLDALVIEGTRLGGRASEANMSEQDLEMQLLADMRIAPGVVLAMYSPLNVDRFVTCFRAARKSGRTFIIDPYQAFVLHLIGKQVKVPQPGITPDLRVLMPPRFSVSGAARRLRHTDWAHELGNGSITAAEIAQNPARFVVLFRQSMQQWLYQDGLPQGATCIFSYWSGYLKEPRLKSLVEAVKATGGRFLQRHASGHAHPEDLRRFVEKVRPRLLVPVHTTSPETWKHWCTATRLASNGEAIEIAGATQSSDKKTPLIMNSPKLEICSLNNLGAHLKAKSYAADNAASILNQLGAFLEATTLPFPRGKCKPAKNYRLKAAPQDEDFNAKSGERKLEAELWKKFGKEDSRFLGGVSKILSFQVPLYSVQKRHGWGSIDLLGIEDGKGGYPVVIELKLDKKTIEPPVRAVVEAVAYMLALRGNWEDFRGEWKARSGSKTVGKPEKLTAVILAPEAYWEKVENDRNLLASLPNLKLLVDGLAAKGYLIRFASIDAKKNAEGDWEIKGSAKEISLPLLCPIVRD